MLQTFYVLLIRGLLVKTHKKSIISSVHQLVGGVNPSVLYFVIVSSPEHNSLLPWRVSVSNLTSIIRRLGEHTQVFPLFLDFAEVVSRGSRMFSCSNDPPPPG